MVEEDGKVKKKKNNYSLMEKMNFNSISERVTNEMIKNDKKKKIYIAFSEYIFLLEELLEEETESYQRYLLLSEIEKLKMEREKYYVPSIFESVRLDLSDEKDRKQSLEKSSYGLIKKLEKRFKK